MSRIVPKTGDIWELYLNKPMHLLLLTQEELEPRNNDRGVYLWNVLDLHAGVCYTELIDVDKGYWRKLA